MGTESPSLPSLCRRFDAAALISHAGTPRSRPPLPGSANPGGHGREPGGLRCHLWGGVNNPSVYEPGSELVFSAEPPSPRFLSPHPLRNKTQHKNKTRRRTEVIHRLYPIINIQAVVCTNTPSNHGGSPAAVFCLNWGARWLLFPRRVPARHRSPRGTGTGRNLPFPGLGDPAGRRARSLQLPRIAFKGEG